MTLARGTLLRAAEAGSPRLVRGDADRVAELLALSMKEALARSEHDDGAIDRLVDLARLLAERLLRQSLELDPDVVVALARGVLAEARSARRVRLFANPGAVGTLENAIKDYDPDGRVHQVSADAALGPGDLRLETELGTVDATLHTGLDLLARRLRDALRS